MPCESSEATLGVSPRRAKNMVDGGESSLATTIHGCVHLSQCWRILSTLLCHGEGDNGNRLGLTK